MFIGHACNITLHCGHQSVTFVQNLSKVGKTDLSTLINQKNSLKLQRHKKRYNLVTQRRTYFKEKVKYLQYFI